MTAECDCFSPEEKADMASAEAKYEVGLPLDAFTEGETHVAIKWYITGHCKGYCETVNPHECDVPHG